MNYRDIPNIIVKDAEIIWTPNFSGSPDEYNRDGGRRYFNWKIEDPADAQELANIGWPVHIWTPKDGEGDPIPNMKINVSFRRIPGIRPMCVYLVKNGKAVKLDEEAIEALDYSNPRILRMEVRPYIYDKEGGKVSAYLQTGYFEIDDDPFYDEFEHDDDPFERGEEVPFD